MVQEQRDSPVEVKADGAAAVSVQPPAPNDGLPTPEPSLDEVVKEEVKQESEPEDGEEVDVDAIPPEALLDVDLEMPESTKEELMAAQLVDYLRAYHSLVLQQRAARHNHQQDKAQGLERDIIFYKTAAGVIQFEYKGARAIAMEIMEATDLQTKKNRGLVLAGK